MIEATLSKDVPGLVFAILPKSKSSSIVKTRYDLSDFAIAKSFARFPKDHYVLMTDCAEFASAVMTDDSFVEALWASVGLSVDGEGDILPQPLIQSIIITDQPKKMPER